LYDQIKVKNTIIISASFLFRQLLADIKKKRTIILYLI